jgi:hypothetical protein
MQVPAHSQYDFSLSCILIRLWTAQKLTLLSITYCPDSFWQDVTNKKWLFEAYAKREGFDPNVASNWYSRAEGLFVHKVSITNFLFSTFHSPNLTPACFCEVNARNTATLLRKYCCYFSRCFLAHSFRKTQVPKYSRLGDCCKISTSQI